MNFIKRQYLKKLNKLLLDALIDSPTSGSLDILDNGVRLNAKGLVKSILIKYEGVIGINNNLPDGYSIKLNKNTIKIRNIYGRGLLDDGLIFNAEGKFEIKSCNIVCFNGDKFKTSINDVDKEQLIGESNTNFEDDTLIIEPSFEEEKVTLSRSYIDDDTIIGLYTTIPFEDGYTGYYNYHPREKVSLSGKIPDAYSVPLYQNKYQKDNKKFIQKINTVLSRVSKTRSGDRSIDVGDEPMKIKRVLKARERAERIVSQIRTKDTAKPTRVKVERKKY